MEQLKRVWRWIRGFFEIAGAIQFLASVGGAGMLAIILPAIANVLLDLPNALLIILGICIFFLTLAVILTILKRILERGALPKSNAQHSETESQKASRAHEEPEDSGEADESFYAQSLQRITEVTFLDQRVPLDGFHYDGCTFEDCTFVYKGEKPFVLNHFKTEGKNIIEVQSPGLREYARLLTALKFISPLVDVAKDIRPSGDVVLGFKITGDADGAQPARKDLEEEATY